MRRICQTFAAAVAAFVGLAVSPAHAQGAAAVGLNIGTPGVGPEIQFQAAPQLVFRGDLDYLRLHHSVTSSDIRYRGKAKALTGGVFADWHPGGGGFLVSAGGYFGRRKLDLTARPASGTVNVGGQSFTAAQIGRIEGEARLKKAAPFVGLGYDNTFVHEAGWGFRALAGVAFSGRPRVNLTSVGGTFSNDPTVVAAVAREEADVRHDVRHFKYFPVVQLGVTRRF